MNLDHDFITAVQERVARVAISASATRGQRSPGLAHAARRHCAAIALANFSVADENQFLTRLDQETERLQKAVPHGARNWGIARKLLNIFLRDSLYTSYLCDHYTLGRSERFLEIPLDSITGAHIWRLDQTPTLPRWRGVKYLSPSVSAAYQKAASEEARSRGIARVHLDTFWWGKRDT